MLDEFKPALCMVAGDVGTSCQCCQRYNHGNAKDSKLIRRRTRARMKADLWKFVRSVEVRGTPHPE
jgi:hypothetical protein